MTRAEAAPDSKLTLSDVNPALVVRHATWCRPCKSTLMLARGNKDVETWLHDQQAAEPTTTVGRVFRDAYGLGMTLFADRVYELAKSGLFADEAFAQHVSTPEAPRPAELVRKELDALSARIRHAATHFDCELSAVEQMKPQAVGVACLNILEGVEGESDRHQLLLASHMVPTDSEQAKVVFGNVLINSGNDHYRLFAHQGVCRCLMLQVRLDEAAAEIRDGLVSWPTDAILNANLLLAVGKSGDRQAFAEQCSTSVRHLTTEWSHNLVLANAAHLTDAMEITSAELDSLLGAPS